MEGLDAQKEDLHCLNCGTKLTGKYCSNCGQKNLPRRQALGDLIVNFIGSFTSFESKFFRTFKYLVIKPGLMINDYNNGKRERFYHPARMYVFLSFVFFLLFSLQPEQDGDLVTIEGDTGDEERKIIDSLRVSLDTVNWAALGPQTVAQYDSIQNTKTPDQRAGVIESFFTRKAIQIQNRYGGDYKAGIKGFVEEFSANIPKMIFLLLPLFALILKLLYVRHDIFYSEHLVFTIFFYDFLFLMGIFLVLFSMIDWLGWMEFVIWLLIFVNLYKSMRKVYSQSRGKTIFKFVLMITMFSFAIGIALLVNVVITFSLM